MTTKIEIQEFYNINYLPYLGSKSWGKYQKLVEVGQKRLDKKRVQLILKNSALINKDSALFDFGCGNPSFLTAFRKRTLSYCVGYDICSHGWESKSENYKHLHLYTGELEELKFEKKFDVVTLWHTLEHEFEPNKILPILYKISSENSLLIIEVPNYNSFTRKIQNKYWGGYHTPRHSVIYTQNSLKEILNRFGWKIEKCYKYGTLDSFTLWWLGHFEKLKAKKNYSPISLESYFWNFVLLKIILFPIFIFEKFFNFGVMTVICKKKETA